MGVLLRGRQFLGAPLLRAARPRRSRGGDGRPRDFLATPRAFLLGIDPRHLGSVPNRWYWHGNEPDIHAPFAFAAVGAPEGTWRWSRWVARTYYDETPGGLPGNDDAGTLSAWYVFAALGVFPITAQDEYIVAAPLLTRAEIQLPSGGSLIIDAPRTATAPGA